MLSKFSVKKPYTVLVAVILVIILGVVSLTRMSTDLLPSMELPYAIIYTTYVGASPEEVESDVTKPIEESMATVSNIKNVSSTSSSNVSMVILEFNQSANMDSAMLEMRENLDMISANWDDSIGSPMIMKLNPDMMPILVAGVEAGNLQGSELSDYVTKEIMPELESIEGVASVSGTGEIEESIQVVIRKEKIDKMNEKITAALDKKFDEAKKGIADAKQELSDGKDKLDDGKSTAAQQLSENQLKVLNAKLDIVKGETQLSVVEQNLTQKKAELKGYKEGLKKIEDGIEKINKNLPKLSKQLAAFEEQKEKYDETLKMYSDILDIIPDKSYGSLNKSQRAAVEGLYTAYIASIDTKKLGQEETLLLANAANLMLQQGSFSEPVTTYTKDTLAQIANAGLAIYDEETKTTLANTLVSNAKTMMEEQASNFDSLDELKKQENTLQSTLSDLEKQKSDMEIEITKAQAMIQGYQEALKAKDEIASGKQTLDEALEQILQGQTQSGTELSEAQTGIAIGEQTVKEQEEKLETSMDQAYEQTKAEKLLTTENVKNILYAQNFSMPAGYVTEDNVDILVRVGDELKDVDDLKDLVLMDLGMEDLEPIKLSDVADVVMTDNSDEVYATINGKDGIMLTMEKQTGYSTGDVTDRILDKFKEIEEETDAHFITLMDQGVYIDMVVDSVVENLLYGGLFAVLILALFLKSIRSTFVVACSIPLSLITAIVLMYFSGVTLNLISLSGLALGVGMLVDNSIVVLENIFRLRKEGLSTKKAAVQGASQVIGAITASTLTTVCVFAPIVFTEGITRQLFVDMGLTIAYSLLSSLIVAMTFVPMMSSVMFKKIKPQKAGFLEKVQDVYGEILRVVLKWKYVVVLGAIGIFALSMVLCLKKGFIYFPSMEGNQISVTMTYDKDMDLADIKEQSNKAIARLEELEGVTDVGAMAGGSSMLSTSSNLNEVTMYLILDEKAKIDNDKLEKEIYDKTADLPCETNVSMDMMDMSALGGSGLSIQVKGKDLDEIEKLAKQVAGIVEKVEGTTEVTDGTEEAVPELHVTVNKEKAAAYNLTVAQVLQELSGRLGDAKKATTLKTIENDYDVYVKSESDEELTKELLEKESMEITDKQGNTEKVPFSKFVTFEDDYGASSIKRDSSTRYMTVTASIADGYNVTLISNQVQKEIDKLTLPSGYHVEMSGEDESIRDAMSQLMLMLVLALAFMYLVMTAQFQSLLSPFIILFTIPLAFTGGFLGLLLTGNELSVIAMIGFIMLAGIIVNNGIVMVDFTNQLRMEGMEKREAIIEAGRTRLRPILMTALTTILGLLTMALGIGNGGTSMVQPMAIVTVGGMLYGTLLTLFIIPCVYDILNRRHYEQEESL